MIHEYNQSFLVDLVIPVNGFDGTSSTPNDGVTFNDAKYLGNSLVNYQLTFPDAGSGTGCVDHPLASDNSGDPLQVCGAAEDVELDIQHQIPNEHQEPH